MTTEISVTVSEFCTRVGVRKTTAYRLIREKAVESRLIGRRRVILMSSVRTLLDLPESAQGDI